MLSVLSRLSASFRAGSKAVIRHLIISVYLAHLHADLIGRINPAPMAFLEAYISRLEAPIAVQVWSTVFGFAREVLTASSTPSAKAQLYPILR